MLSVQHAAEDSVAAAPAADDRLLIFNEARFHALSVAPPRRYLRLDHPAGSLCGVQDGREFASGAGAPFGGPDLADPEASPSEIRALLEHALEKLRRAGVIDVRIHARPPCYSPAEPVVEYVLHELGFVVEHCDLNQHVALTTLDDYLASLAKKRRRDLRCDLQEPFELRDAADALELAECHALIDSNRAARGRPAWLPLDYLTRLRAAFPGRVRVHRLAHAGRLVAAAVVYRVLPGRDLLVAWADGRHDLQRSPMNLLAYRLVEASIATGAWLLDLGPSTEKDGSLNAGLAHFKRSVGALATPRRVFRWRAPV